MLVHISRPVFQVKSRTVSYTCISTWVRERHNHCYDWEECGRVPRWISVNMVLTLPLTCIQRAKVVKHAGMHVRHQAQCVQNIFAKKLDLISKRQKITFSLSPTAQYRPSTSWVTCIIRVLQGFDIVAFCHTNCYGRYSFTMHTVYHRLK